MGNNASLVSSQGFLCDFNQTSDRTDNHRSQLISRSVVILIVLNVRLRLDGSDIGGSSVCSIDDDRENEKFNQGVRGTINEHSFRRSRQRDNGRR